MCKEKVEKDEERATKIVEVIFEVKGSVVADVSEEKIKLANDFENVGYQNVVGWHEALAKLTGRPVNTGSDPIENMGKDKQKKDEEKEKKKRREEKKTQKILAGDDQA